MDTKLKTAIIKTIAYSDIFDFPLTRKELHVYLERETIDSPELLSQDLIQDIPQVEFKKNLFYLTGREGLIERRRKHQLFSKKKLALAERVARRLSIIPWVKMIAVTGAVAVGNANEDHDIDLLIVTTPGRMWVSRLLEKMVTELMGRRRRPRNYQKRVVKDKICPNIYMDASSLHFPYQDLFTAREMAQMRVILNRDNTYEKFILANQWVKEFLPNCSVVSKKTESKRQVNSPLRGIDAPLIDLFERISKTVQLKYMAGKRTTETIGDRLLMFHPQDQRIITMKKYQEKLRKMGV